MPVLAGDPRALPLRHPQLELSRIRTTLAPTLECAEALLGETSQAAVALLLRAAGGEPSRTELLLIRRAQRPGDPWSGHMALPGGRRDPTDLSLLDTARRESLEEIGLQLDRSATLIGRLPSLPAVALGRPVEMTISPLVFQLTEAAELQRNEEVAETLWVALEDLCSGQLDTFVDLPLPGASRTTMRLPAWAVQGRIVWGLTHRMISTLFDLLDPTDSHGNRTDFESPRPKR